MIIVEDIFQSESNEKSHCLIYVSPQVPQYQALGMGSIAATLKREKIGYSFYTMVFNQAEEVEERIRNLDAEVFMFSVYDWNLKRSKDLISLVKKYHPGKRIIVGGIACHSYEYVIDELGADIAVIGEGEDTILEVLAATDLSTVNGIAYSDEGVIRKNEARAPVDINKVASPYLMNVFNKRFYGNRMAYMFTKGCVFSCTYCYWGSPKESGQFRKKDQDIVTEELKHAWSRGVRKIQSQDAIFNFSTEYLQKLEEYLAADHVKFMWTDADCRADMLTEEQAVIMKRMGVIEVGLGIETVNKKTQTIIKKHLDPEKLKEAVRILRKHHFKIHAGIQIGLPGETEDDARKTFEFVKQLQLDEVGVFHTRLQPGTELYETMQGRAGEGRLFKLADNEQIPKERINKLIEEFYTELQPISSKITLLFDGNHYPYTIQKLKRGYQLNIHLKLNAEDILRGIEEELKMLSGITEINIFSDGETLPGLKEQFPLAEINQRSQQSK